MDCTGLPTSLHGLRGELSGQNPIALFDSNTVARKLVIWGETSCARTFEANLRNVQGTNAPGCADLVILPSSVIFCTEHEQTWFDTVNERTHSEGVYPISIAIECVHQMHGWTR